MSHELELVFETHSLTTDNELGFATGWHGGELSARGRTLAAELGTRRGDDGIEVVLASDLARSVETARIAFGETAVPVVLDWRLREIDYGVLNGAPVTRIERERRRRIESPFPGGESYLDASRRVGWFLAELASRRPGGRVLVIGHTATRWALDLVLTGTPLDQLVDAPFEWREGWEYTIEAARGEPVSSSS